MEEIGSVAVLVVALLVMLIGLIGTVVPIIPGTILIFVAALVYAVIDGFRAVGWPTLVLLGVMAAVATTADIWASSVGAKMGGASIWSVLAGLAGGLVGMLLFTLPGAIIGAVLGVLLAEVARRGDWEQALKAGGGWAIGWALSMVANIAIGLAMVAIFVWQVWQGQ